MSTEIKKIGDCKYEAIVEADKKEWEKSVEKAYAKFEKNITVPGFRKGNVPKDIARKQININDVMQEALNFQLEKDLKDLIEKEKLNIIDQPKVDVEKISLEELKAKVILTVEPVVKLGEYKGIKVDKDPILVVDEDIDAEIENLRKNSAELHIKEGEAKLGDTVIIDFEGFIADKPFEGGKAEKFELELGSKSFIPGFEEALEGLKKGDKKDMALKFPENYNPDFAGKDAVFKIFVHEVKEKKLPEINDDFALDSGIDGVSNLEDLRNHFEKELRSGQEKEQTNKALDKLIDIIIDNAEVEVAEETIEKETENRIQNVKEDLKRQNATFEDYLEKNKLNEFGFKKKMKEYSKKSLVFAFIVVNIAKNENIKVEEKDVDKAIEDIAKMYGQPAEEIKKHFKDQLGNLRHELLYNKVYEFLKENNNI